MGLEVALEDDNPPDAISDGFLREYAIHRTMPATSAAPRLAITAFLFRPCRRRLIAVTLLSAGAEGATRSTVAWGIGRSGTEDSTNLLMVPQTGQRTLLPICDSPAWKISEQGLPSLSRPWHCRSNTGHLSDEVVDGDPSAYTQVTDRADGTQIPLLQVLVQVLPAMAARTTMLFPLGCVWETHVNQRTLFAKRVRRLRKAANLSLDKAGEKGGLSGKYWGEVKRSEKSPTLDKLLAMARALDVPIYALVQIEREEDEEKVLRSSIDRILDKSTVKQLKRVYCYLLDTSDTK